MLRTVSLLILLLATLPGIVHAQFNFKRVYQPDTNTFDGIGFLNAPGIIETGIPGREIVVTGALNGQDTSGFAMATFLFQADINGVPRSFDYYADTNLFAFSTPRSFALCYDGMASYYLATGSNDNQIVARVDTGGNLLWATDVNHHDFYDIICEGASVALLGQDESMVGGHDFSIVRVNDGGTSTGLNIHGSLDFDIPNGMGRLIDGYVLAGQTVGTGERNVTLMKVDNQFDLSWGHVLGTPGRQLFCNDLAVAPDQGSIYLTGFVRRDAAHPSDSIFVAKVDTSGAPLWMRFYGNDTITNIGAYTMAVDPVESSLILGGEFDATGWRSPFVMHLDSAGNFDWARNYSEPDTSFEEVIEGIAISPDGRYFSAVGTHNFIPPNFLIDRGFFVIRSEVATGKTNCDTTLDFGFRNVPLIPNNIIITGTPGPPPSVPYGLRQGGGVILDSLKCQSLVAVDEKIVSGPELTVVNPVLHELVAECEVDWMGGAIQLHSTQGQLLWSQELEAGGHRLRWDASQLPQGIYMVTVLDPLRGQQTRKVVVMQ